MNSYNFSLLLFAFGVFFVGLLIWLKRGDKIGKCYFILGIFAGLWAAIFSIMLSNNVSSKTALIAARISEGLAVFIPPSWFRFCAVFSNEEKKFKGLIKFLYGLAFFLTALSLSSWFITGVNPALGFDYYARPGVAFHIYVVAMLIFTPFGFFLLIKKLKRSQDREEKLQIKGLIFSTFLGFSGGILTLAPFYELMVPQYGLFLMPFYPFAMAYFMIRRGLFDLEQIAQTFQREKLATIGLLAASVNHEIRNPLFAARGLLETFIENEKAGLPRKAPLETSEKALAQLNRALEVIGKLNRFAKPAEGGSNQIASISEVVQAVLDLISYEFSLENIEIKNHLPEDLPQIHADQRQLEEILFNLIVNACHAMPNGGELVIAASCHSERSEESMHRSFANAQDDKIVITIQDTGTGISPEQARYLFEPFHTTKGDKGTGLGLYITKQLIERNGGKISVQSKPGQGTSFILEFKRA